MLYHLCRIEQDARVSTHTHTLPANRCEPYFYAVFVHRSAFYCSMAIDVLHLLLVVINGLA